MLEDGGRRSLGRVEVRAARLGVHGVPEVHEYLLALLCDEGPPLVADLDGPLLLAANRDLQALLLSPYLVHLLLQVHYQPLDDLHELVLVLYLVEQPILLLLEVLAVLVEVADVSPCQGYLFEKLVVLIGLQTDEVAQAVDVVGHLLAAVPRCLCLLLSLEDLLLECQNSFLEEALLRHHLGYMLVLVIDGLAFLLQALLNDVALPSDNAALPIRPAA